MVFYCSKARLPTTPNPATLLLSILLLSYLTVIYSIIQGRSNYDIYLFNLLSASFYETDAKGEGNLSRKFLKRHGN